MKKDIMEMTLIEKIRKINTPSIEKTIGLLPEGKNDTIEDFVDKFIKPRLPEEIIIKKWHKLLMDYVSDPTNLSCCVRYGNNGSKKTNNHGEAGYKKLRRGWLTKNTNDDFEYFYADNYFASFIYKMALDKFVPTLKEMQETFKKHEFPYGFGFHIDKKQCEYKGVVISTASQPGFMGQYKLSHIFDVGKSFCVNGNIYNDTELSQLYYDIGHSDDFLKNKDLVRKMKITDEAKQVIVAKFLRFAHPLNYFLTPSKKRHTCGVKINKNDIGEHVLLINYMRKYIEDSYPKEYNEFLNKIMWNISDKTQPYVTGEENIFISYGQNKSKSKLPPKLKKSQLKPFSTSKVKKSLIDILTSDSIPQAEIDKLKTKEISHEIFGLNYALLATWVKDYKGYSRYYTEPINVNGETLFLCSQWYDKQKTSLKKWIRKHGGKI
jgi:hypothetical protein